MTEHIELGDSYDDRSQPRPLHPQVSLYFAEKLMRPVIPMKLLGHTFDTRRTPCWGHTQSVEVAGDEAQMMRVAQKKRENIWRYFAHDPKKLPIWC